MNVTIPKAAQLSSDTRLLRGEAGPEAFAVTAPAATARPELSSIAPPKHRCAW